MINYIGLKHTPNFKPNFTGAISYIVGAYQDQIGVSLPRPGHANPNPNPNPNSNPYRRLAY